jgi:acetyltransferase-like isoleucine patch superfamily enzyme
MSRAPVRLSYDWYDGVIPANVELGADAYVDTAYSFAAFRSRRQPGMVLGEAAGVYDRTALVVGPRGRVTVGAYTCLNSITVFCDEAVTIGAHCLLAWGAVLTDTWPGPAIPAAARRAAVRAAARDRDRLLPPVAPPRPVTLEDNVWVGFDAVVLPGVTLGRGCVVGCKSVVAEDVPPYAVVAGDPPRVVRYLDPDDEEDRHRALREYGRGPAPLPEGSCP